MRRSGASAIQPKAGHAGVTLAFVRDEGRLADEERLVEANVAAEASVGGIEAQRPRQLVTVERQPGLDAQTVARGQATGRSAQLQQARCQRRRLIRVDEEFIGHALAGIAGARDDQIEFGECCMHYGGPGESSQTCQVAFVSAQRGQDLAAARALQRQVNASFFSAGGGAQVAQGEALAVLQAAPGEARGRSAPRHL